MTLSQLNAGMSQLWQQLPQFSRYPIQPPALWLLLGLAAIVVVFLPMLWWLFQFVAFIFLAFLVLTYGYECLARTAQGVSEPPSVQDVLSSGEWGLPLVQLVVLMIFGAFGAIATALFGSFGWVLFLAFFNVTLPASMIVLGVDRAFMSAVNPVHVWEMGKRLGWPYLALVGLLFAQELVLASVLSVVSWIMPGGVGGRPYLAVLTVLLVFFTVMYFHVMGYLMRQYHDVLGYEVPGEDEPPAGGDDGLSFRLSVYDALMSEKKHGAALAELRSVVEAYPDNISLHERLFRLAAMVDDTSTLVVEADWLIRRQTALGRASDSMRTFLECLRAKPDYRPDTPESIETLARELRKGGKVREAIQLMNGFHKRFPNHPQTPAVYVLAAQIFMEDAKRPDQARTILTYLQRHHPGNVHQSKVDALLRALDKQSASSP